MSPASLSGEDPLSLVLVCDDDLVASTVRMSCGPPHAVTRFPLAGVTGPQHTLAEAGGAIVEAARTAEIVLVEWQMERAPVINTLCYHVRRALLAPVVMLCRSGGEEQTAAIAAGADAAVTFPLYLPLLRAHALAYHRLASAARAAAPPTASSERTDDDAHAFGPLRLNRTTHRFYVREAEVELTPREFALIGDLIAHADTLCTRDQLLDRVWGINFDTGTNMVDVYMYFLRRKLEAHGVTGMIQTVRGHGYRLILPPSEEPGLP